MKQLLEVFRKYPDYHVYFTREGHRPTLSTLSDREKYRSSNNSLRLGIGDHTPLGRALIRGEPGHEVVPELYPLEHEEIIDKPGRGAFAHTELELMLRNEGIKNLILAGVTTDVCVSTTMREANDRGFDCLLAEDACSAATPSGHSATIESIKAEGGIFGAVSRVNEIVQAIEGIMVKYEKRMERPSTGNETPITPTPPIGHLDVLSTPVDQPGYVPIDPDMTSHYPQ